MNDMKRNLLLGIVGLITALVITCNNQFLQEDNTGDTTAPALSAGSVNRTSDTQATIGFTTDEAGTGYYLVVEKDAAAPANTAVKAGTSLGAVSGAVSGKAVTLTAGAKDIYVVVEDAAGNISAALKIVAAAYDPGGNPSTTYIITFAGGSFIVTRDGTQIAANSDIQTVIDAIRTAAAGESVAVQFGNGTDVLDIGTETVRFTHDSVTAQWGAITLTGKITGNVTTATTGVIHSSGDVSITSRADIANTGAGGSAIYNESAGAVTISGGTVSATTGSAVYNSSTGQITVSGTAAVTSANTDSDSGTIFIADNGTGAGVRLEISGGTVSNTSAGANGNAVYNGSTGAVTVSGGTVSTTATSGNYAINNTSTGVVTITSPHAVITGNTTGVTQGGGDTTAPALSAGSVNRTSDTAATIGFTTDEAGTAYYLVVEKDAAAPANTAVKAGTSLQAVTAGANTGKAVTLTARAKDIYVVVEDAMGNISEPLKIEVATYDPGAPALAFELISGGDNDGTYRVTKGTYTTGAVVIPSTYNGVAVTEIGATGDTSATSAFAGTTITSITIPASVKVIGASAFYNLTSLTSVTIEAGSALTAINRNTFFGCANLTGITIPDGVTSIGEQAFQGCTAITSLTIPAAVTSVGNYAFRGCTGITSLTVPATVTTVAYNVFAGWTAGQTITVPFANAGARPTGWDDNWNGGNVTIAYTTPAPALAFEYITSGDNAGTYRVRKGTVTTGAVVIPATYNDGTNGEKAVTEIGAENEPNGAFAGTTITSISIPASVKVIGYGAFSSVTSLTTVTFAAGSTLTTIGASSFSGCTGITSLTIPASVTSVGSNAVRSWTNSQTVTVPSANAGAMPSGWNSLWNYQSSATITYTTPAPVAPNWNNDLVGKTFRKGSETISFSGSSATQNRTVSHSNGTTTTNFRIASSMNAVFLVDNASYDSFDMTISGNTVYITNANGVTAILAGEWTLSQPSRGPTWAELTGKTFYKDGATITFSGVAPASGQINHDNGSGNINLWPVTYLSGTTMTLEGNNIQLTITTTDGTTITFAGGTGTSAQVLQGTWGPQ